MIYFKALILVMLFVVAFPAMVICMVCLYLAQRIMR